MVVNFVLCVAAIVVCVRILRIEAYSFIIVRDGRFVLVEFAFSKATVVVYASA